MAIENCTISAYSNAEGFGDNYGEGEISLITCSITADFGYTVAASDFSWVDGGVSYSSPQPVGGQYKYQSDLNNFSYNLNQPLNYDVAPVVFGQNPAFSQNTVFPKFVIFRNSTQANDPNNIIMVDIILWDEFTMPNASVGMKLDINGSATSVWQNVINDDDGGSPPVGGGDDGIVIINDTDDDDTDDGNTGPTYGSFSMGVIFAETIQGTFTSPTTGNQYPTYAGNPLIEQGLPYSTKWDQRVVGSDSGVTEEEGPVSGDFAEWAEAQVSNPMDTLRVAAPYYYAPFLSVWASSGASSALPNVYWGMGVPGGGFPGYLPWWFNLCTNGESGSPTSTILDYIDSPFNVWDWAPGSNGGEAITLPNDEDFVSHLAANQTVSAQLVSRASFGHIQANYFGVEPEVGYNWNSGGYVQPLFSMDSIPGSHDRDNLIQNIPPRTLRPPFVTYSSPSDLATNYFRPTSTHRLSNGGEMKMTRRPNYLSSNPAPTIGSQYLTWDGRRRFEWIDYTSVEGSNQTSTTNNWWQVFRDYDQVRYYRIKATNGHAINKNLFRFPQGLEPSKGYITGHITKKPLLDPQIILPSNALSTSAEFLFGPWDSELTGQAYPYNVGTPASGTIEYYLKTLFQGQTGDVNFDALSIIGDGIPGLGTNVPAQGGEWLWNDSSLGNNLPSIIRYPAVYLSSDLSTKRYDVIDYIELQNGINYNPGAFFEGMSQIEIGNNIDQFLNTIYVDQTNYSMWENNEVEIRIKFNPEFRHNFQIGDGYFENVEVIIPIETNPISNGPIVPNGPNVPFVTTVGITGGMPGELTVSNDDQSSNNAIVVGLNTNKRGEVDEEQVLTYRGFTTVNKRKNVGTFNIEAPTGKYFSKPPTVTADNKLTVKTTNIDLSNINKDANNRITSYSYDIKYKNKVKSSLGDKIKYNIIAPTMDVPINDDKYFIRGISYGRNTIYKRGEVRQITIVGDPGADFELELNKKGKVSGSFDDATILKRNTPYYKKLDYNSYKGEEKAVLVGKLNKRGKFSFNATFPKNNGLSTEYILGLRSGNNSLMTNNLEDVYILNQYTDVRVRCYAEKTGAMDGVCALRYSFNGGSFSVDLPEITGPANTSLDKPIVVPIIIAVISTDGSDISQKGGIGAPLFLTSPQKVRNGATLTSDWEDSYTSENGGAIYDITNAAWSEGATPIDMELSFDLHVYRWGTESNSLSFNINNFLQS